MAANYQYSTKTRMSKFFETSFGYARVLARPDLADLQLLCERCGDVAMLLGGTPPAANAAEAMYRDASAAAGQGAEGLCVGLFDWQDRMIGVLAARRDEPVKGDWYIGNLMFVPEARSRGYGAETVRAFADYVQAFRGERILLSVMWTNEDGMRFWNNNGFQPLRPIEPTRFGQLLQTGIEMVRFVKL